MGRKWARYKTRDQAWSDITKIIEAFTIQPPENQVWNNEPRRVQGGGGRSTFNFSFYIEQRKYGASPSFDVKHTYSRLDKFVSNLCYKLLNVHVIWSLSSLEIRMYLATQPRCKKCGSGFIDVTTHPGTSRISYRCDDCEDIWDVIE